MRKKKIFYDSDLTKFDSISGEISCTSKIDALNFEDGSQKSEVGSRKSEVGSRKYLLGFRIGLLSSPRRNCLRERRAGSFPEQRLVTVST